MHRDKSLSESFIDCDKSVGQFLYECFVAHMAGEPREAEVVLVPGDGNAYYAHICITRIYSPQVGASMEKKN